MPTLIRLKDGVYSLVEDPFTAVADDQGVPPGDVIISLTRFQSEGEGLLGEGRSVGVRLESQEEVEALAYDLPQLAVVAAGDFPKFRRRPRLQPPRGLLRRRFSFKGEVPRRRRRAARARRASRSAAGSTPSSRRTVRPRRTGKGPPIASVTSINAPYDGRPPAYAEQGGEVSMAYDHTHLSSGGGQRRAAACWTAELRHALLSIRAP